MLCEHPEHVVFAHPEHDVQTSGAYYFMRLFPGSFLNEGARTKVEHQDQNQGTGTFNKMTLTIIIILLT